MNILSKYKDFVNELDPYGEEIWDDDVFELGQIVYVNGVESFVRLHNLKCRIIRKYVSENMYLVRILKSAPGHQSGLLQGDDLLLNGDMISSEEK